MKITCFGDLHIGNKNFGFLDSETGLNTREIDALNLIDKIIDYNLENSIKLLVFAGDMYKNNSPSPTLQTKVNEKIKRGVDAGLTILLLDGNHDISKMETAHSALKNFDTFNVEGVIHTRFHKEYIYEENSEKIKFVFLPTYHTKESIEEIVNNTIYDIPVIFIFHGTLQGANLNDYLIEHRETFVDSKLFHRDGVLGVICGHLHKHQIINKKPLIFYTGSTQRIDFNEENQEKGFVVFDIKNLDYEFIELDSQKFMTINMDLTTEIDIEGKLLNEINKNSKKIKDAIVRIQLDLEEGTRFNERNIYNTLEQIGAKNVLDIQKNFNYKRNMRNKELTENISIKQGLELFYKDKIRQKERIELGNKLIEEMEKKEK